LKAFPLAKTNSKPLEYPNTQFNSEMKSELIKELDLNGREYDVKFDILTKKNLKEQLK
jgi:hypothetical protein